MKAKEKAKELVDKYKPICAGYNGGQSNKYFSKKAALIACDEIFDIVQYNTDDEYAYWQQVKTEINNL